MSNCFTKKNLGAPEINALGHQRELKSLADNQHMAGIHLSNNLAGPLHLQCKKANIY